MTNGEKTGRRVLIVVGIVALACALLSIGAVAVGGAVYAVTRDADWLGAWTEDVSLAVTGRAAPEGDERGIITALDADDDEQGIVIGALVEDGPAAAAGVERGDILLELDGKTVNSHLDLIDALQGLEAGDEVELRVLHGDDERRLTATLEERDGQAFLGVVPCCAIRESHVSIHDREDVPVGGALITDVVEDSPADEAGLEAGDVILAVDGEELGDDLTLADAVGAYEPGDRVTLTVQSPDAEDEQRVAVELGEHPDDEGVAYLGVTYLAAPTARVGPFPGPGMPDPDLPRWRPYIERFRGVLPEGLPGVTVMEVDPDSPAEEAGLREGDIILTIEGESLATPEHVVSAVTGREPGDELTMTIRRPGEGDDGDEELELSITLGEHPDHEGRAYLGVRLGFLGARFRRFGGQWEPEGQHFEFDLPEGWDPESWHFEFDLPDDWDLPFGLEELPDHFEFEFLPGDDEIHWEVLLGDESV